MKQSLNKLVNNLYTGEQKLEVKEVIRHHKNENINDEHLLNYAILAIGLDEIEVATLPELIEFYKIENLDDVKSLTDVDYVISSIIITLSKLTNKDIKTGYENALVLDKTQPEFEYLVKEVTSYLSK